MGFLQRATARFSQSRSTDQFKSTPAPHRQIFRLNRQHRTDIGQIVHAHKPRFSIPDFPHGFRRNNHGARPQGKLEDALALLPSAPAGPAVGLRKQIETDLARFKTAP